MSAGYTSTGVSVIVYYFIADISIYTTVNGFVEVSQYDSLDLIMTFPRNLSCLELLHSLLHLMVLVVIILILHGGQNYLLSTAQGHDFGMAVNNVAKHHHGK